ncbi:MAG: hypothetical protein R2879_07710 [Saprospiraceae bacterium]
MQTSFYYKMPKQLHPFDTSAGWFAKGKNPVDRNYRLEPDGKSPARNITLYYYHTNKGGIYAVDPTKFDNMPKNKLGQTHGYLRGWIKPEKMVSMQFILLCLAAIHLEMNSPMSI